MNVLYSEHRYVIESEENRFIEVSFFSDGSCYIKEHSTSDNTRDHRVIPNTLFHNLYPDLSKLITDYYNKPIYHTPSEGVKHSPL